MSTGRWLHLLGIWAATGLRLAFLAARDCPGWGRVGHSPAESSMSDVKLLFILQLAFVPFLPLFILLLTPHLLAFARMDGLTSLLKTC